MSFEKSRLFSALMNVWKRNAFNPSLCDTANLFFSPQTCFVSWQFWVSNLRFLIFSLALLSLWKKCFLLHIFSPLTLCKTFVRQLGTSFYLEWSLRRNSNFSVCAEWLYRSEESSAAGLFENDVRFLSDSWVYSHLLRRRVTWLLWYSYKLKESGKLTEFCRTIIHLLYFINYIFSAAFAS